MDYTIYEFDSYNFKKDYDELFYDLLKYSDKDSYDCKELANKIMSNKIDKYSNVRRVKF